MTNVSDSNYEDQDDHDIDIEIEPQEDPYPYPTPIPNQRPKWDQKLIQVARDIVGDPYEKIRTMSQCHNEHDILSHLDPLLPNRCFMIMGSCPQSFKEAFHDPRWKEAMDDEYGSLQDNMTWELITLPPRRKLVR